jgi:hypothetical protein
MNGYLDSQTSGNDWASPIHIMLHEIPQIASSVPTLGTRRSILSGLEQQMAEFEADHQEIIGEVQKLYVMSNDSSVIAFLDGHRTIPQLLIQAAPRLQEHFGESTVFSLRAVIDEYGWQTLYAVIVWPGKVDDVVMALDRFEDEWWIANSTPASGSLTFTYELV